MNPNELEKRCQERFDEKGDDLFKAMMRVAKKDFCVTTGFEEDEISIAISCNSEGRLFKFEDGYSTLVAPDGERIDIENAEYGDIADYLPNYPIAGGEDWKHCSVDRPQNRT